MRIELEGTWDEIVAEMLAMLGQNRTKNISVDMSERENLAKAPGKSPGKLGPNGAGLQGPGPDEDVPIGADAPGGLASGTIDSLEKGTPRSAGATPPKAAAAKAAKGKKATPAPAQDVLDAIPESEPEEAEPELDPAALAKLRTQTIEDLQAAYSNGKQKEVFALLSKFGNGAKSFRELAADAFLPIRKAIDAGALA